MATEVRVTRIAKLENRVEIGEHRLTSDEPAAAGGGDRGPDPYGLLLAALGSCISMTLTLYAERKGWPLEGIEVHLRHEKVHADDCEECESSGSARIDRIEKRLSLEGPLDDGQRERLRSIAARCPVHRTLTEEVVIAEKD